MADYDAKVRVGTKVDTSQMQKLQIAIDKAQEKVNALAAKQEELKGKKVPTAPYEELERQVSRAKEELQRLVAQEAAMESAGLNMGSPWDRLLEKEADVQLRIESLQEKMQQLADTGRAFTVGGSREEMEQMEKSLSMARRELAALNTKKQELINKQFRSVEGYKKMERAGKRAMNTIGQQTKKSNGLLSQMGTRLKGLALSLLVFNWISKGFNKLVSTMKEGFQNLAQYTDRYNESMSELKSRSEQTKNSLATAFEPVVSKVIPYITALLGYVDRACEALTRFQAAAAGEKTYVKAKEQVIDYAKTVKTASKEAQNALASFDSINVLNKGSKADSGGTLEGADAFETVEIDKEYLEKVEHLRAELEALKKEYREGVKNGFQTEKLGEVQKKAAEIKEDVKEILRNPNLQEAAKKYTSSTAKTLGILAGAGVSAGISFGEGILGGVEQTLAEPGNQEYVAEKLTDTYGHLTETNESVSEFATALAEIAKAFESDSFQDMVAFLTKLTEIGILEGLDTLSGLLSDITGLFAKPFSDNKEEIKGLLEDVFVLIDEILTPLGELLGLINEDSKGYDESALHAFFEWLTGKESVSLHDTLVRMRDAVQWLTDKVRGFKEGVREAKEAISYNMEELQRCWAENSEKVKEKFAPVQEKIDGFKESVAMAKEKISGIVSEGMDFVGKKIGGKLDEIGDYWGEKMGLLKAKTTSIFEGIRNEIKTAIEKIKSCMHFEWSLPNLKLPHFSVSGGEAPWGFGGKGSLPSIGIEWYKEGGIMTHPTVFGFDGSSLLAGGEPVTGGEAILPLNQFYDRLDEILSRQQQPIKGGTLILELDGRTLARAELPYLQEEQQRIGVSFG